MPKPISHINCILILCFLCFSCSKPEIEQAKIVIDPKVRYSPVFKELDKQTEPLDVTAYLHKIKKVKTSDVNYGTDEHYSKNYICKALLNNDKLKIDIGIGGLFTANGFNILCTNNSFSIKPYFETDAVIVPEPKSTYQIIKQSLILNKPEYIKGDSIFGYVDFKLVENKTIYNKGEANTEQKITHIGKGYFRGKVE